MIRFFQGIKEIKNFREDYEDFKNKITASVETTRALYYRDGLRVGEKIAKEIKDSVTLQIKKFKEEFDDNKLIVASINSKERFHALSMRLDDLEKALHKAFSKLEEHTSQSPNQLTIPVEQVKSTKKPKPLNPQSVEEEVKKVKSRLTQAKVKRLFEYRDGELYWKVDRLRAKKGDKAGTTKGYKIVFIEGQHYTFGHVIFLMFHGYVPERVSFVDGDYRNTRIENLRAATMSQVSGSAKKSKANTCGYKGITFLKKRNKYVAQINKLGKHYHLGTFNTPQEAYKVYCKAAKILHKEFARVA